MRSCVRLVTMCLGLAVASSSMGVDGGSIPPILTDIQHEVMAKLETAVPDRQGPAATEFLRAIIAPRLKGMPVDICVLAPGGEIVYDSDSTQIGLKLYTALSRV
jgi:hypothetical protein